MDERFKDGTEHLHIVKDIEKFLARYGSYSVADVLKVLKMRRARRLL